MNNLLYYRTDADSPWQSIPAIKGEKGEQGEAGKDGADGLPGKDGINGKDGAPGKDGVDGYTPIKGTDYFTEAEIIQIEANAANKVDLTGYATESYVNKAIEGVVAGEVDLSSYAKTSDLEAYATEAYVDTAISEIEQSGNGIGAPGGGVNAEIFNYYESNVASGDYSHAEGYGTQASGKNSHAQGNMTKARGTNSHAEGTFTEAWSFSSHAEGDNTIAYGECQHVQGRYNIKDEEQKYAHIVGNGEHGLEGGRSNAHTLDWDGNAWYAGTVEGTALILSSPNGTRYKITVNDSGTLSAAAL